jgi:hypothetical protein
MVKPSAVGLDGRARRQCARPPPICPVYVLEEEAAAEAALGDTSGHPA